MILTGNGNHRHLKVIDVVNEREGLKNGESKSLRCDDYLAVDNKTFHDDASKHGKTPSDEYFY